MSFRRVLFWCHLVSGLFVGVVVFIMSFTGVILTYEKQMLAWADQRAAAISVPASGTPRASIDRLIDAVRTEWPDGTITAITRRVDPVAPVTIALNNGRTLLLNPYSGQLLREAPTALRQFFRASTEWHRYLAGSGENRALGKAITGACNLAFLFIVLSGLYLWMPRRWSTNAVAAIAIPRLRHATGKARDFNWHNALGVWSAVPLAIVVASATVISYPWASDLAYRIVGEAPPPRATAAPGKPSVVVIHDLNRYWERAESQVVGWRTISLRMPTSPAAPLVFTIDEGWAGQPHKRGTLSLDAQTGAVTRWETFDSQTRGRRLRSILRFAHTGEVLGIPGQTIAGVVSAAACVLMITGFALAWRRFTTWRRRSSAQDLLKAA